jgi:predicted RNA-binding protein with PIN domain
MFQDQALRSRSCNVVLNWLAIGETCRTCAKNLNNFKNEMQDRLINLNKYDNNDISIIFDEIFPNSTISSVLTCTGICFLFTTSNPMQISILLVT